MKTVFVLVIIGLAVVGASNVTDDTEVTTLKNEHELENSSEERRSMRPIFPKTVQKLMLTTQSTRPENVTTSIHRTSKMPVYKIISKAVKLQNKNYWKTATTRQALMKHTKFTVNPLSTVKILRNPNSKSDKDGGVGRIYDNNKIIKTSKAENKDDDSSEEILETTTASEKLKDKTNHVRTLIHRFHKLHSKISKSKYADNSTLSQGDDKLNTHKDVTTDKIKPSQSEFSSEEKEDRNEFIFVTSKKFKGHTVKVTEDNDESSETTTVMLEKEIKQKQRRSINVIEEENLGTTVSGFKFTGKVTSLNSNFAFRNINT